jgi:hypothetical protein
VHHDFGLQDGAVSGVRPLPPVNLDLPGGLSPLFLRGKLACSLEGTGGTGLARSLRRGLTGARCGEYKQGAQVLSEHFGENGTRYIHSARERLRLDVLIEVHDTPFATQQAAPNALREDTRTTFSFCKE